MNLTSLEQAIWNWANAAAAASVTGTTVYWDNPAAPRPPLPNVRLKVISGPTEIGLDELQPDASAPDKFTIVGPRQLTLSVNCYGQQARQIASDMQTSLSDPASQATLELGGVSTLTTSPLRDLSAMLETQYEQRCQFDIEMLATEVSTVQPGSVQEVDAAGTVTTDRGTAIPAPITVTNTP